MDDDSRALDKGWDGLPSYGSAASDADEAVTLSVSTTPGEWLVNTVDSVVVPMSMVEVVEALRAHQLNERSLVWRTGMQEWQPVDRVPQLKLAARLPATHPAAPPPARPSRPQPPPKPSPAPVARPSAPRASVTSVAPSSSPPQSSSPVRPSSPQSSSPVRPSSPPQSSSPVRPSSPPPPVSRRSTLPGLAAPVRSRPSASVSPLPRPAVPPPASAEESDVLAVYDRPAATLSFDLLPEREARVLAPAATAPQTLAPTTTDSVPHQRPLRNADLSVVAASQFRDAQRSSKRLLWISSLGSAAIASALTLWFSSSPAPSGSSASSAAAPFEAIAPKPPAPVITPPPEAAPSVAPEPPAAAPSAAASAKPRSKSKHKARAIARRAPAPVATERSGAPEPGAEPNPYDVKLEEDPAPEKAAPSESPSLEPPTPASETKPASGS